MRPLRLTRGVHAPSYAPGALAAVMTRDEPEPALQAATFIHTFKAAYGDRHPRWVEGSCRTAMAQAKAEYRFLLMYLHAPEHQVRFCRNPTP